MALLAVAEYRWPWPAPQDFPRPAWFYSELLTFLWERNSNLEERKGFGLHAGRRVSVVKELRSSPELILCHPHHTAAIPTDVPTWWQQLWALWGQGATRACTRGFWPVDWVLQWQGLGGHQGWVVMKANTESEPFCHICAPLWLHLLLTKLLTFSPPFFVVLCLLRARGISTHLLLQLWWKQHAGHPGLLPQHSSQPRYLSLLFWLRTFSPGVLWPFLGQVKVSPSSLNETVLRVVFSSKCFRNNGWWCIVSELWFSSDKIPGISSLDGRNLA